MRKYFVVTLNADLTIAEDKTEVITSYSRKDAIEQFHIATKNGSEPMVLLDDRFKRIKTHQLTVSQVKSLQLFYGYKVSFCSDFVGEDGRNSVYQVTFSDIAHTNDVPDVVSTVNLEPGESGYLVWVNWSSGNSMSICENGSYESLAIFKTEEQAEAFTNAMSLSANEISYIEDGQLFYMTYPAWVGYFEQDAQFKIERFQIATCD